MSAAVAICLTYTVLIKLGEVGLRAEYFYRKRGGFHTP